MKVHSRWLLSTTRSEPIGPLLLDETASIVRPLSRLQSDVAISFTDDPTRQEITYNLKSYQNASGRPDLVARVFQQKVEISCQDALLTLSSIHTVFEKNEERELHT